MRTDHTLEHIPPSVSDAGEEKYNFYSRAGSYNIQCGSHSPYVAFEQLTCGQSKLRHAVSMKSTLDFKDLT